MLLINKIIACGVVFIAGWISADQTNQKPAPNFMASHCYYEDSIEHCRELSYRKIIPKQIERPVLMALSHYPELRNVWITFVIKNQYATLSTHPTAASMLMPPGHREYIITISNKTIPELTPLLFENLPAAARVGVIGHELAHVVDFANDSYLESFKKAAGHLSPRYLDKMEFNTDKICIEHGLGKPLEEWSGYIRSTMNTKNWRGADYVKKANSNFERYMNPSTIEMFMMNDKKATPTIKTFSPTVFPNWP